MHRLCLILLIVFSAPANALPLHAAKPGGIAVIEVGTGDTAPSVFFEEKKVLVVRDGATWYAVVGIPLSREIGPASVNIKGQNESARDIEFEIVSYPYREQHLTVERSYVEPDKAQLDRILGERKIIDAALNNWNDIDVESLSLLEPVSGPRSSSFGSRRFFNGQPRSPHSGMDISANSGTTIVAPLDGIVTATGNYFFNGNTVILDHGQGFVTMYCHLDRIDVEEDQSVAAGTALGIVGATGRVTGPHLHFGTYLGGSAVDPTLVLPSED